MTSDPVHVGRGGTLFFTYSGVIAIATAFGAWVRMEMKTEWQEKRISAVEATAGIVATKNDVKELQSRVDRVLELMLEQQSNRGSRK